MYGMVVKALGDVARQRLGDGAWCDICTRAAAPEHFIATRDYPEALVVDLLELVAEDLGVPVDDVLHSLGRHWIRFTAREGWGPLLQALGPDLPTALGRLDALHLRVGLVLPHLRPPSFSVADVDDEGLLLLYRSERAGLHAMVVGLVEEMGESYGTPVAVAHVGARGDSSAFRVRFLPHHPTPARDGCP